MLRLRPSLAQKSQRMIEALDKALAIIEFDPTGKILAANELFCSLMGYKSSEIIGQHHSMFVDPAYAASPAYKEFWIKLGQGTFDSQEYLRIGKGGKQVWIQASYNPILNRSGKVVRIVKLASDKTAARLRNANFEAKLAAISRVQGVIEFAPTGEIIDANENLLNLLGYRLDEIVGKHHRMLVEKNYGESAEYQEFWRKLREGEFVAGEFKRVGKAGQDIWIQASYNPIFDLNNKVASIVKFATDITGRVEAVTKVAAGLAELADNNLEHRLDKAFEPAFEQVRSDYNASLERLESTISQIAGSSETIQTGTQEIATSISGMSRRIEEQAAGLEQTAAALSEITTTVKQTAEGALEAALAASGARSGAALSSKVMNQTATVMNAISDSSNKITQIIDVMDEIAFQTNLLALNAGVEAARAGDSGRGFAVVAQEVRALAQRSATAAKEIKSLIDSSSGEVRLGVKLVTETAASLDDVTKKVAQIDASLSEMAQSAKRQAAGLGEVNIAVNRMDEVTQQNAAMIEQSTAAASTLNDEAVGMTKLMAQFRIGTATNSSAPKLSIVNRISQPSSMGTRRQTVG